MNKNIDISMKLFWVLRELTMTLIYVLFAFLYKWFGLASNGSFLTSMNFHRWFVEASYAPFHFCVFVLKYYIGYKNIVTMALKVPLFFLMRWAESQPNFFLNNFESLLISELCKLVLKWNLYIL